MLESAAPDKGRIKHVRTITDRQLLPRRYVLTDGEMHIVVTRFLATLRSVTWRTYAITAPRRGAVGSTTLQSARACRSREATISAPRASQRRRQLLVSNLTT